MTDCMLRPVFLIVKWLGRKHMPVILTDQIRLFHIRCNFSFRITPRMSAIVKKIVVRINILQKMAFL